MAGPHVSAASSHRAARRVVTARQLAASLRAVVEESIRFGEDSRWEPAPDSQAAHQWAAATRDPLARTLGEADAHGVVLLRSGLEHAAVAAQAISAARVFAPLTVGRTAAEHCLRSHYLLDTDVDDVTRAGRRLNEWLHAVSEMQRLHTGVATSGQLEPDNLPGSAPQLAKIELRASQLGLNLAGKNDRRHVAEVGPRVSTMQLADHYLSDDASIGVTAAVYRAVNAVMHGLETGLLPSTEATETSFDVMAMTPRQMRTGELSLYLMLVPMAVSNATSAFGRRFQLPAGVRWTRLLRLRDAMIHTWSTAIETEAPEH